MPRIVHFEICADKPERAVAFYTKVFGWKTEKWAGAEDYWMANTGADKEPGINGAIMQKRDPKWTTVNTVDVPSVDDYVSKVTKNGGKVVAPKVAIPGMGYVAYCQDTEGNVFGIWQTDTSAK